MDVSLTPRLEEMVREDLERERLREALIAGEDSGPAEPFDMEALIAELDRRG